MLSQRPIGRHSAASLVASGLGRMEVSAGWGDMASSDGSVCVETERRV